MKGPLKCWTFYEIMIKYAFYSTAISPTNLKFKNYFNLWNKTVTLEYDWKNKKQSSVLKPLLILAVE